MHYYNCELTCRKKKEVLLIAMHKAVLSLLPACLCIRQPIANSLLKKVCGGGWPVVSRNILKERIWPMLPLWRN